MLYLEDYLEMIENLPMEMRDRFTEMREMDLQVQNGMDTLDEQVKVLFKKCCAQNVDENWKKEQFQKIKEGYYKALDHADEKVQLANEIYSMVDKHLRKLDVELQKFKMELEADNAGVTEKLEKRSLELDAPLAMPQSNRLKERRHLHTTTTSHTDKIHKDRMLSSIATEAVREVFSSRPTQSSSFTSALSPSPISYISGNAALAQAAQQAIAATTQLQQGRRTSSLKASYDIMTKNPKFTQELVASSAYSSGSGSGLDHTPVPSPITVPQPSTSRNLSARSRKKKRKQEAQAAAAAALLQQQQQHQQQQHGVADSQIVDDNQATMDWAIDPNEPRYCLCNQVSYGDMVGCDNNDCPIEWFHYGCVGLTHAPKGKWFCPQCTAAMKRRGRR